MKNKILISAIVLLPTVLMYSQVGVKTSSPNSTFTVEGSFEASYKEVNSSTYNISSSDYSITYNGGSNTTFQLPSIGLGSSSFTGRVYKIKNISAFQIVLQASNGNTLRVNNTVVSSFTIPAGAYAEVVNNSNASGGTWDLSFSVSSKSSNVEIYGAQLRIPPHNNGGVADWSNHSNSNYDSVITNDTWWIISKSSSGYVHNANYHNSSKMILVYEYQGTPFDISNIYPILTAGNNSNFPDIFSGSFISLANNGTGGKTRLTVAVSRVDYVGQNINDSNWQGASLLNILLAKKVN